MAPYPFAGCDGLQSHQDRVRGYKFPAYHVHWQTSGRYARFRGLSSGLSRLLRAALLRGVRSPTSSCISST